MFYRRELLTFNFLSLPSLGVMYFYRGLLLQYTWTMEYRPWSYEIPTTARILDSALQLILFHWLREITQKKASINVLACKPEWWEYNEEEKFVSKRRWWEWKMSTRKKYRKKENRSQMTGFKGSSQVVMDEGRKEGRISVTIRPSW